MTPEALREWHEKEPRGTHCGGYYKCEFCAAEVSQVKALETAAVEGYAGRISQRRGPTQTDDAAARARAARRSKAKAAKRARKLQRRRAR